MADQPVVPTGEIVLYQTEDGRTRVECRFADETLWLSQALIAELFQKDVRTINEHLQNIYDEGEIDPGATIRKFRIVRREVMGDGHANMQFPLSPGRYCSLSSTATCSPWGGTQRTYESHFRRPRRRSDGPGHFASVTEEPSSQCGGPQNLSEVVSPKPGAVQGDLGCRGRSYRSLALVGCPGGAGSLNFKNPIAQQRRALRHRPRIEFGPHGTLSDSRGEGQQSRCIVNGDVVSQVDFLWASVIGDGPVFLAFRCISWTPATTLTPSPPWPAL